MLRVKIQHKYYLTCTQCGYVTPNFWTWFDQNQQCPQCGSKHSEVWYNRRYHRLSRIFKRNPDRFWQYFPFLPLLRRRHIISRGEGAIPVERWSFLEDFAKKTYDLDINVYVYRNDLNGGTGTKILPHRWQPVCLKNLVLTSIALPQPEFCNSVCQISIHGQCELSFMPEDAIKTSEGHNQLLYFNSISCNGRLCKSQEIALIMQKSITYLCPLATLIPSG